MIGILGITENICSKTAGINTVYNTFSLKIFEIGQVARK